MKAKPYDRYFYCFMFVIFGLQTYDAYNRHAFGETVLYGLAAVASVGLILYFTLIRKAKPPVG